MMAITPAAIQRRKTPTKGSSYGQYQPFDYMGVESPSSLPSYLDRIRYPGVFTGTTGDEKQSFVDQMQQVAESSAVNPTPTGMMGFWELRGGRKPTANDLQEEQERMGLGTARGGRTPTTNVRVAAPQLNAIQRRLRNFTAAPASQGYYESF